MHSNNMSLPFVINHIISYDDIPITSKMMKMVIKGTVANCEDQQARYHDDEIMMGPYLLKPSRDRINITYCDMKEEDHGRRDEME
jgi:hypothetical protein